MRSLDFTSWQAILTSIAGLLMVTLIGMGIRLLMMMTIQQRRERQNRQINERLKALIAAYKILGGSFTGTLTVDPSHMRELKQALGATRQAPVSSSVVAGPTDPKPFKAKDGVLPAVIPDEVGAEGSAAAGGSDRARRIRDAVEAALSDIVLFGTEAQVTLAAAAMRDMVAGRPVHMHELVAELRAHIRQTLDLDPIPATVLIPNQGPARPSASSARGGRDAGGGARGAGEGGMGGGGMAMGGGGGGMAVAEEAAASKA